MKKINIVIIMILTISIGNYFRIIGNEQVRTVEFISILTIGILIGVLVTQFLDSILIKIKLD